MSLRGGAHFTAKPPSHHVTPVSSPAEPGGRSAQGEAGPGLRGEVGRQPDHGGSSPAPDAMPQVRGLPADGVRRVPLLQGHEEVRGPRADEAELHHEAVHRGECAPGRASPRPRLAEGQPFLPPSSLRVGLLSASPSAERQCGRSRNPRGALPPGKRGGP